MPKCVRGLLTLTVTEVGDFKVTSLKAKKKVCAYLSSLLYKTVKSLRAS